MNLDQLRAFCLSLPHTTEQIQWEAHLLFKVGGKMYLITSPDDPALPMSLKASVEEFDSLIEIEGVIPAPYMARNKWIRVESTRTLPPATLRDLIARSYELVVAKLPKKQRAALGGATNEKPRPGAKQTRVQKKTTRKKAKSQTSSAAKARARSKASLP